MRTRIKVCCIGSVEEARLAVRLGADALGLVGAMPSGPGVIEPEQIAEIARAVPPPIATFLLTSSTDPDEIVEQQRHSGANTLQLVDTQPAGTYARLRRAMPGVALVQVIHVAGDDSVAEAAALAPHVDAILLDSGDPSLPVKELGGTGRVHDWDVSRRIVEAVDRPIFLAGGLRASNVARALRDVRPFGVDVCSGVRTEGALDGGKLRAFFDAALDRHA